MHFSNRFWLFMIVAVSVLCLLLVSSGQTQDEVKFIIKPPKELINAKPIQIEANAGEFRRLLIDRRNIALSEVRQRYTDFATAMANSASDLSSLGHSVIRLHEAELALSTSAKDRIQAHERHLIFARYFEELAVAVVKGGRLRIPNDEYGRHFRVDAEIRLAQEKMAINPK